MQGVAHRHRSSPHQHVRSPRAGAPQAVALALIGTFTGACTSSAALSMLAPMATQNPRDPDPFKPLVPTPGSQTPRDSGHVKAAGVPIAAAESFAALVAWAAGKGPLFVGVSGTFDETEWLRHRGPNVKLPPPPPTAPAATGNEVLRPAIPEGEDEDAGEVPQRATEPPR